MSEEHLFARPKWPKPKPVPKASSYIRVDGKNCRHRSRFDVFQEQVIDLYQSGVGFRVIAAEIGCAETSIPTIVSRLVRLGLLDRRTPRHEPTKPKKLPPRVRPMIGRVQREWPEPTPCRSSADGP